jgi:hypothetical protein
MVLNIARLHYAHAAPFGRDKSSRNQGQFHVSVTSSRLIEVQFRVAFVTYGTQGTPLICKNFFNDLVAVLPAFREDPSKLGMGQTSCGGDMGMAALEGFVAALEVMFLSYSTSLYVLTILQLFDLLRQSAQAKNLPYPPAYHIFHLAAAVPDTAERPQCNLSPILDSVTWDSLPSEMKKVLLFALTPTFQLIAICSEIFILVRLTFDQNFRNFRICILYVLSHRLGGS